MLNKLTLETVSFFEADPRRIQHFIKVHAFAGLIGREEGLGAEELLTLEAAAIVHDVGIKPAEEKYGDCNGKLQEQEGPAVAKELLEKVGAEPALITRICYLVGHHHTYTDIDGADYQILVEADFLVNFFEDGLDREHIRPAYEKIFRTKTGRKLCETMFGL